MGAGDIESMPFIQALGQFSYRVGENTWFVPQSVFFWWVCDV